MNPEVTPREPATLGTIFSSLDRLDAAMLAMRAPGGTIMRFSSNHG